MYCGSADMISLPSNLSYIGRSAFSGVNAYNSYDCSFNLNLSNKYIYENGCLIDKSEGVLLWANGNVTIPEETWLTTIGQDAFCETKMTSIIIPANIKVIEDSAFYEAFNLTNITFLGNEIAIGKSAFFRTNSLTSITLSGKVSIGATAFDSSGLETITINNTNSLVIEEGTFSRCNNLHTVNITGDITSIGDNAFNTDSTSLTISFSDNTPATLNGSRIFNTANTAIYVPNEQAYKAAWSAYSQIIFSE